jgi:hypothetical protein
LEDKTVLEVGSFSTKLEGKSTAAASSTVEKMSESDQAGQSNLARLIESPELDCLSFLQKEFLRTRWLGQTEWFGNKAKQEQKSFYRTRKTMIICSVLAPFLISIGSADKVGLTIAGNAQSVEVQTNGSQSISVEDLAFYPGLILSQLVAVLAAIEQFYKFGDRWRHYRRTAEILKSCGWQFFQLGGAYAVYAKSGGHKEAFPLFAAQVEEIIQSDVDGFISHIAVQKTAKQNEDDK